MSNCNCVDLKITKDSFKLIVNFPERVCGCGHCVHYHIRDHCSICDLRTAMGLQPLTCGKFVSRAEYNLGGSK